MFVFYIEIQILVFTNPITVGSFLMMLEGLIVPGTFESNYLRDKNSGTRTPHHDRFKVFSAE